LGIHIEISPFEFEIEVNKDTCQQQHKQECERHDDEQQCQASDTDQTGTSEKQQQAAYGEQDENGHCDLRLIGKNSKKIDRNSPNIRSGSILGSVLG